MTPMREIIGEVPPRPACVAYRQQCWQVHWEEQEDVGEDVVVEGRLAIGWNGIDNADSVLVVERSS